MAKVLRKYSEEECQSFRERIIHDEFLPLVQKQFRKHPELKSATMFVAQYWNDEAYDAVHYDLLYSFAQDPDFSDYNRRRTESEEQDDAYDEHLEWLVEGKEGAAKLSLDHQSFSERWQKHNVRNWDENFNIIPYFAAFTREGGDQEASFAENYSPYAVFQRDGENISVQVVGEMHREWLDGVPCEWELEQEQQAKNAEKSPGFWSRLFGRK